MNRKGFFATSIIYSFFLVFLMIMAVILTRNVNNRILLNALKNEIRIELESDKSFVEQDIEQKGYNVGEIISFAGETWQVIKQSSNTDATVVLILNRALTRGELIEAIGISSTDNIYFNNCNEVQCPIRGCRDVPSFNIIDPPPGIYGRETCYYDSRHPSEFVRSGWNPTEDQKFDENFGKSIVSEAVTNWFLSQSALIKVKDNGKLRVQTFSDGYKNYPQPGQEPIYVRIPLESELTTVSAWGNIKPFHIIAERTNLTDDRIKIYNGSSATSVLSNSSALIRPVIEVQKG